MKSTLQKAVFLFRRHYVHSLLLNSIRKTKWRLLGMEIGNGTIVSKMYVTWPHTVGIGKNCKLEHDIYFKFDGPWVEGRRISIGNGAFVGSGCEFNISGSINIGQETMIASGCRFVDHDHGMALGENINIQTPIIEPIHIDEHVWIGANCVILKGVQIGKGAVVAASSVVTKSVGPFEIVGGVPAKLIKKRV